MSRRRALIAAAIAVPFVSIVVACASFDTSSTSDHEAGAPQPDAATDATSEAAPAAPGAFCASHADAGLCADFDEGQPVGFHFLETVGSVDVAHASFVSPPAALRAVSAMKQAFVKGHASAPAFAQKQRLSFEIYSGTPGQDAGVTASSVVSSIVQGGNGCAFDVESFGTAARLNVAIPVDGGATKYENYPLSAYPPPGQWAHVEVVLESDAGVTAQVTIANVAALPLRLTMCPALATDAFVIVGLIGSAGAGPTGEAHFDNVLFESN